MSQRSRELQEKKLQEIENVDPYRRRLAGFRYTVLPKVYPGGTDTALLCDAIDIKKGEDGWDIGTGTGLVALKMKQKGAKYVLATDKSPKALRNAKLNSRNLKLKLDVRQADVFGGIKRRFDVITFNPPFTDRAPQKLYQIMFWDRGNRATRAFFSGLRRHLKKNGRAFACWSSFGTKHLLGKLAKANKLKITPLQRKLGSDKLYYDVFKVTPTGTPR